MAATVLESTIYNVRYRMEDARIFDEKTIVFATGNAANTSDTESSITIRLAYADTLSYSFSRTSSTPTAATTTIDAGLPTIVDHGKIEIFAEKSYTLEWGETTTETKTVEATFTSTVPAKSQVRVNYVGNQGTCSVPFSYTQKDRMSDGSIVISEHNDGTFTGTNNYGFRFELAVIEPLGS